MVCNAFLLFDKMPHSSFIMLQTGYPKIRLVWPYRKKAVGSISRNLSSKLVSFYTSFQKRNAVLIFFLAFQLNLALTFPLTIVEIVRILRGNYFPDLRTILCALACPFWLRYLVSAINIGIQFMLQNRLIQIKQKHYFAGLKVQKLFANYRNHGETVLGFQKAYWKCRKLMNNILDLTREID